MFIAYDLETTRKKIMAQVVAASTATKPKRPLPMPPSEPKSKKAKPASEPASKHAKFDSAPWNQSLSSGSKDYEVKNDNEVQKGNEEKKEVSWFDTKQYETQNAAWYTPVKKTEKKGMLVDG